MTEEVIFNEALAMGPADRGAYLDQACAGDPALRAAVEALLRANVGATGFLESPPARPAGIVAPPAAASASDDNAGSVEPTARQIMDRLPAGGTIDDPAGRAGMIIAGRYKLLQQIGEGGMGTVWMSEQTEPVKRRVAVKLIRVERGRSKSILSRFEAERQAIALMDHPHIARLLDAGTAENGAPFFVMELVKGQPLTEFCDTQKLDVPERLRLFMQVCAAVQHAHQKGVIHRDLKPSNVLVESHDGKPVPKIIDFGLAKATTGLQLSEHTLFTAFGTVMGTPLYMAPEQASASALDVDTRADIYALGIILYELLTGTTPITRDTLKKAALDEMLKLIREQEVPTPSSRLSSAGSAPSVAANRQTEPTKLGRFVKGELDWIVLKALAKERDRRYETANGFARDIERFLNHEPVTAGPPTVGYRLRKFARRNRGPVVAAGLVLLALVAGVVGTTAGMFRANRAADAERLAKDDALEQKRLAEQAAEQERLAKAREAQRADGEQKAKLSEESRRQEAERNLAFAKKGNEILGSVFAGLDPKQIAESGRPLQDVLRENLGKAVKELEGSAIGDPLEVAAMQNTLGLSLRALGEYALAVEVFDKALKARQAKLGPDDPLTLISMNNLALGYMDAGKLDQALPLFEETLKLQKAKLGPDHPSTLITMDNLGVAYGAAGKLDKALPLMEESFQLSKAKLGSDHPDTLLRMNNLAVCYKKAGRLDLALPLYEETLKLRKAKLGPDHPDTLGTMNNLAMGYEAAGRLDKALPLLEETVKLSKAKLGPDHPETLLKMSNLAVCYQAAGQFDLALPLFEETFKLKKAKLGPDHPQTLLSMNNLAVCYLAAGQLDKAMPLLEETLKLMKAKLGLDHPNTLSCMNNLGTAYSDAGKLDVAVPLLEETLKLAKAKEGPDHPGTLNSMYNLARAYGRLNRLDQSIPLLEMNLQLAEKKLGRQHPDTLVIVGSLGAAYKDAGRLTEAIPLLEEAYRARRKHPSLSTIGAHLAAAYAKAGETAKLADLLQEQLGEARKTLPKGSPQLAGVLAQVGLGLLEQKKYSEAEPLLRESMTIREKTQPDAWTTFSTQSMLGGALLGQKKYIDAEPLLLQGYEGMKEREKTIPPEGMPRILEALDRLVELYTVTNRPDKTKQWQAEKAKYPPINPITKEKPDTK